MEQTNPRNRPFQPTADAHAFDTARTRKSPTANKRWKPSFDHTVSCPAGIGGGQRRDLLVRSRPVLDENPFSHRALTTPFQKEATGVSSSAPPSSMNTCFNVPGLVTGSRAVAPPPAHASRCVGFLKSRSRVPRFLTWNCWSLLDRRISIANMLAEKKLLDGTSKMNVSHRPCRQKARPGRPSSLR